MKTVKKATPAAIAVLRQATKLRPARKKASDGLLPSKAHMKASPDSDHDTGYAVDLTNDPKNGINCAEIFEKLKTDKRVKYMIFNGLIWAKDKAKSGNRKYTGSNKHLKHLHISIRQGSGNDATSWFSWIPKIKSTVVGKAQLAISNIKPLPKKRRSS